jgi:hypothetical protein
MLIIDGDKLKAMVNKWDIGFTSKEIFFQAIKDCQLPIKSPTVERVIRFFEERGYAEGYREHGKAIADLIRYLHSELGQKQTTEKQVERVIKWAESHSQLLPLGTSLGINLKSVADLIRLLFGMEQKTWDMERDFPEETINPKTEE